MKPEYLVVGSGLTGSVIARELKDSGKDVLVIEKRSQVGGNIVDYVHPSGIRVHKYGPHYFRTNDDDLWRFVNRFGDFFKYEPVLRSLVDGQHENWPITAGYIADKVGANWSAAFVGEPRNFEEASLSMMPRVVYEKFVKGYTEKQWGVSASSLAASLAKRFDVRNDGDCRLMRQRYQGIPYEGYSRLIERMLENILVILNCDYHATRAGIVPRQMTVYTGPIDEFFGCDLGRLIYRGQKRVHRYFPGVQFMQPVGQVNNPDPAEGAHIRTLEWKHMMPAEYRDSIIGTVVTQEFPFSPDDSMHYEYPFPDDANQLLYKCYRERANSLGNILICGRLGEYRYYDMDQAIARGRLLARRLLARAV